MFKRFPLFFLCAALFSGCATHPKHTPAAVETAETLGLPASSQPPIAPQWWRALNDAKLDGLIDTALARSPDLAAAQARLRQAQAGADLADSQRGVKIGLGLSGALLHRDGVNEREKPELISDLEKRLLGDHGTNITYESLQLQGQWSPDVFGKYKHQLEAALGQQRAVEAAVRDQTEMTALARKNAAAAQSRYRAGLDNKLDWLAAQDETLQNEAQLAQAQAKLFTAWLALNTAFGGGFAADK